MEQILDILIKIVAVLIAAGISFLVNEATKWVKSKVSAAEAEKLDKFIDYLTEAAEQLLKEEDEDGSKRLDYVYTNLAEAGIEITEAVRALIESKVWRINGGGW